MYAIRTENYNDKTKIMDETKKCKGVNRCTVKNDISFDDYKDSLFNCKAKEDYNIGFRSYKQQIYTQKVKKKSLSPFDNKRYLLEGGISSLPYGHYKIKK